MWDNFFNESMFFESSLTRFFHRESQWHAQDDVWWPFFHLKAMIAAKRHNETFSFTRNERVLLFWCWTKPANPDLSRTESSKVQMPKAFMHDQFIVDKFVSSHTLKRSRLKVHLTTPCEKIRLGYHGNYTPQVEVFLNQWHAVLWKSSMERQTWRRAVHPRNMWVTRERLRSCIEYWIPAGYPERS